MSATTNDYGLADKHSYDELTDKQQRVVDAWVSDPDLSEAQVAERAGCSHAYPHIVKDSYGDIIEALREANGGGNAADLDAELGDDRPVQHFSERPYSPDDGDDTMASEDDGPEGEQAIDEDELAEAYRDANSGYPLTVDDRPDFTGCEKARIDDFLPERTCQRLEAIAEDIMPVGIERRASVEEVITHLAETYTLPSETVDIRE